MNLIEIANNLKDVPDQILLKEVQRPSGAYPAYLVVSEMGRRKRMRDAATKEPPQTTVAQDLAQPSREDMMAAMARAQQAQMMSQPAPRLNAQASSPAGLMGMPEAAQSLAAQDAMAAQPVQRMAGGGMVAFERGGEVQRFQTGGQPRYGMRFEDLPMYETPPANSLGEMIGNFFTRPGQRIDPVTGEPLYLGEFLRRQEAERTRAAAPVAQAIVENAARANPQAAINIALTNPAGAAEMANRDPIIAQHLANAQVNQQRPPAAAPAPAAPAAAAPVAKMPALPKVNLSVPTYNDPYSALMAENLKQVQALKEPTAEELRAARTAGRAEYEQNVPFRMGFLEQEIAKRGKDLEARRGSNVNEALIQAGLGIMGSKSPRFLQAAGEAGTLALQQYRQGLKDIREGEKDILQSKTALAQAQMLYDQGKESAAEKAETKGLAAYERGMNRLNTESAVIARNQAANLSAYQAQISGVNAAANLAKLPYEMQLSQAQARYYTDPSLRGGAGGGRGQTVLSDADQKAAEESARTRALMTPGIKFGTPEYQNTFNRFYQEEIQRRAAGINYVAPAGNQPVIRNPNAPLGAQ